MGGNDGVRLPAHQGGEQLRPLPHLDIAGRVQVQAHRTRDVDIEPGEDIVLVEIVEGREVALGEKTNHRPARRCLILIGFDLRCRRLRPHRRRRQAPHKSNKK